MLGLDNPIHIAFLLILLLLVFGAKRLPEMGKSLGAGMRGFKDSLTGEGAQPMHAVHQAAVGAPAPALAAAPAPAATAEAVPAAPATSPAASPVTPAPAAPVAAPAAASAGEPPAAAAG